MSYSYRLHPLTKLDYDEAYQWYEEQQKGLGERFIKTNQGYIHQFYPPHKKAPAQKIPKGIALCFLNDPQL